jgi:hypothetical protein
MTIKFNCPHCKKVLTVKNEYAGRRGQCSSCKKPVVVPAPVSQAVDIEQVAAAALADAPAAPAAPQSTKNIEFVCTFCEAKVTVTSDLAGKRTPCPECRRIVKVPEPGEGKPKDWRQVDPRRPSGARPEVGPAPEGAWSTRDLGAVSRESLIEADAVPEPRRRLSWHQWVRRGLVAAIAVAIIAFGSWLTVSTIDRRHKQEVLDNAVAAAEDSSLSPEFAAELHRVLGDYYVLIGRATGEGDQGARSQYQKARTAALAAKAISADERDLILKEILLGQANLGGNTAEIEAGARIRPEDMQKEVRQTAQNLSSPEGRALALRALTKKYRDLGLQAPLPLASQFGDDAPQLHLAIGLDLVEAKDQAAAETLVTQVQAALKAKAPKPVSKPPADGAKPDPNAKPEPTAKPDEDKPKGPPPSAALLALLVALRKDGEAAALAPPPEGDAQPETSVLVGYVEGWARRGEVEKARKRARDARFAVDRFPALMAVAEVELDKQRSNEAAADLEQCLALANGELKGKISSPWVLYRLTKLASLASLGEKALPVANSIREPGLRSRAQLAILQHRVRDTKGAVDASVADMVDKESLSHALALQAIAHHNSRTSGYRFARGQVAAWDSPRERPFGDIGIALGLSE